MQHNVIRKVSAKKGTLKGTYKLARMPEDASIMRDMCEIHMRGTETLTVTAPDGATFTVNMQGMIGAMLAAKEAYLIRHDGVARRMLVNPNAARNVRAASGL